MRNGIKLAGAGAVVVGTLAGGWLTGLPVAQAAVSPSHRTCWAEQSYIQHPSAMALNTMLTASEGAPWKYIGEDAASLYAAVRGGKPAATVAKAEAYFSEDCAKVGV